MLVLTHAPSPSMDQGQRTHVPYVTLNYELAAKQHADYCGMLRGCGAEVTTLDVNQAYPDCTFIEDTAIVLDEVAVLASMGAPTRRGEPAGIEPELRRFREVQRLEPQQTMEGGDVLRLGRTLCVGLSSRTSIAGLRAFEGIVRYYGYRVLPVSIQHCLHLKTACTALPDNSLLLNPCWLDVHCLSEFKQIAVPRAEPSGANTLTVGNTVCLAADHVQTADMLQQRGFRVRTVELSEFTKAEGGVTCLSLVVDS